MRKIVGLALLLLPLSASNAASNASAAPLGAEDARFYLSRLSTTLAQRPLTAAETRLIEAEGDASIPKILGAWAKQPGLSESFRVFLQQMLTVNGKRDDIDFDLPGQLAAYVVRKQLPYSTLLTADYCVNSLGERAVCDTGAPYTAGVLTTRAYLIANRGHFNLGRAGALLRGFVCREYPMEYSVQPPLPRQDLLPLFQPDGSTPLVAEQVALARAIHPVSLSRTLDRDDPPPTNNGTACYSCHGQFGAHAQLFVRFDRDGRWIQDATGLQDPREERGQSDRGLYVSHLQKPESARSESSQMFGAPVSNLAEAARALVSHPIFLECATRNALRHSLRLQASDATKINVALIRDIATRLKTTTPEPSYDQILLSALTHPKVIESVLATRPPPRTDPRRGALK